ncbi:amidohydrolase [Streptomyces carminius]|uniref:Amidohydrolase n=1 Tax=Streptomyces carminius TaxID=2665496 RepID=A0A2M8LV62_9ACTN|nr:amidohydrolase family protein [Streptomyces carminius]PJE95837.1 amidohydrolase [Streptomyces carminius]
MDALLSAGGVVTGPDGRLLRDGAVLVQGGVITAVGPRTELEGRAPHDATRFAYPGGTLLPGLVDAHVHLVLDAGPDPVTALQHTDDAALLPTMAHRARQLLNAGVTTVRDLGDRGGLAIRLRDEIAAGRQSGPRVLAAGTPLTAPGGHCWFLGGEAEGADAIRRVVRRTVERGADVVKVMATGGGLTRGGPPVWAAQFTTDELRLVVEEARQAGLPVAAHAHGTAGIAAAVAAGVSTIEHCTWMGPDGFEVREDVVEEMAARGIAVCPAASPDWRGFAHRFGPERAQEMFARMAWMHQRGVRLIAGTDAGISRAVFDDPVSSLEFFAHLGHTPAQIIDLATHRTAQALGIGHDTGLLHPGYRADLLAVAGNPLDDLQALRNPRLVMTGGHPHLPEPPHPRT